MLAMFQPRNVLCLFASKPINRFRTKYGTTPRWEIKPVYLNMENQYKQLAWFRVLESSVWQAFWQVLYINIFYSISFIWQEASWKSNGISFHNDDLACNGFMLKNTSL